MVVGAGRKAVVLLLLGGSFWGSIRFPMWVVRCNAIFGWLFYGATFMVFIQLIVPLSWLCLLCLMFLIADYSSLWILRWVPSQVSSFGIFCFMGDHFVTVTGMHDGSLLTIVQGSSLKFSAYLFRLSLLVSFFNGLGRMISVIVRSNYVE